MKKGCFERLKLAFSGYQIELCVNRLQGIFGYKGLIELVPADFLYPKLTVYRWPNASFCLQN